MNYTDRMTYAVAVAEKPDGERRAFARVMSTDIPGRSALLGQAERHHVATGERVRILVGALCEERLYWLVEDGMTYMIDSSGTPAYMGRADGAEANEQEGEQS